MAQYSLNPKHATALGATTELMTKAPVGMSPLLVGAFRDSKIDRLLMNVIVSNTYWCHVMVSLVPRTHCMSNGPFRQTLHWESPHV